MAKRSRTKTRDQSNEGEVGPRQPCPCGSGKRYKACHGQAGGATEIFVRRPFEGLASECDVIAMRELVPAATAPLRLRESAGGADRNVLLCTLLPGAAPAMVRESGDIWLALQVQHQFNDPSRDLAAVLERALATEEEGVIGVIEQAGEGARLQDLVTDDPLQVTVHEGFDYWLADVPDSEDMAAALEQANGTVMPTARLASVEAAYWTNVGSKEHLRWVLPEPESQLLDALARLHVSGKDVIVPDARLVGMFRTQGVLVPVWDLPVGTGAEAVEDPAAQFRVDLDAALADPRDLTSEERGARSGLANRQVTIR